MTQLKLKILPNHIYQDFDLEEIIFENILKNIPQQQNTIQEFTFYTSSSVVYSSKIEGEEIDFDSYIKHKVLGIKFLEDYTKKADDLFEAYSYARNHLLNEKSLLEAHKLLSKNLLKSSERGRWRTAAMFVMGGEKISYVAAQPHEVKPALKRFFRDLETLLSSKLTLKETFFYASLLHLIFLNIHPLNDGNGRTARLLEKWFLASKIGDFAWQIPSEKYYFENKLEYYHNLQRMGFEYGELDYAKAIPFLKMLGSVV
jgi:Fic family protein